MIPLTNMELKNIPQKIYSWLFDDVLLNDSKEYKERMKIITENLEHDYHLKAIQTKFLKK